MANEFGELVRKARIEKGWSQRELARRIKKSPTYIHYVERGVNPSTDAAMMVGEDAVVKIAETLGIDEDEARLAAGYAPATSKHIVGGYEIELPGDVASLMLYTDIKDEADLEAFKESFRIAYEITKQRIADRDKNKNDD